METEDAAPATPSMCVFLCFAQQNLIQAPPVPARKQKDMASGTQIARRRQITMTKTRPTPLRFVPRPQQMPCVTPHDVDSHPLFLNAPSILTP